MIISATLSKCLGGSCLISFPSSRFSWMFIGASPLPVKQLVLCRSYLGVTNSRDFFRTVMISFWISPNSEFFSSQCRCPCSSFLRWRSGLPLSSASGISLTSWLQYSSRSTVSVKKGSSLGLNLQLLRNIWLMSLWNSLGCLQLPYLKLFSMLCRSMGFRTTLKQSGMENYLMLMGFLKGQEDWCFFSFFVISQHRLISYFFPTVNFLSDDSMSSAGLPLLRFCSRLLTVLEISSFSASLRCLLLGLPTLLMVGGVMGCRDMPRGRSELMKFLCSLVSSILKIPSSFIWNLEYLLYLVNICHHGKIALFCSFCGQ